MEIILDLSKLQKEDRLSLVDSPPEGWVVRHLSSPQVHPDRIASPYYYSFSVLDFLQRCRSNKQSV